LRQVNVRTFQERALADAIRATGVSEVSYYHWRREHGDLRGDQANRVHGPCSVLRRPHPGAMSINALLEAAGLSDMIARLVIRTSRDG